MHSPRRIACLGLLVAIVAAAAGSVLVKRGERTPPLSPNASPTPTAHRPIAKADPSPARPVLATIASTVQDGVAIALRVGQIDPAKAGRSTLREGDDVVLGLELKDAASGLPLTRAKPAAWLVVDEAPGVADDPRKTVLLAKSLLDARYFTPSRADLNVYYMLTLNEDTVSVVDPLHGFGGMKLVALVPLGGRGFDWVIVPDRDRLFVTVPEAAAVVAIDTRDWRVVRSIATPRKPARIGVQPDGQAVWVACAGGTTAVERPKAARIGVDSLRVEATADIGAGPHDLAFGDEGRTLFVTNADAGTLTLIDPAEPDRATTLETGRQPVSVAYSRLARSAWVAHAEAGGIAVVDPARRRVSSRIEPRATFTHLRFTPDGRRALAVSARSEAVVVLDAASGQPVQRGRIDGEPDHVDFSEGFAYVRRRASPMLRAFPLEGLGVAGRPLPETEIPMGIGPLGRFRLASPADSLAGAPGGGAILIVNSEDRSVHFYKEGMSAPMGSFRLRNGEPRAVLAVDRSLTERHTPGFYETTLALPEPADYKVVVYLASPKLVHAFRLRVEADPDRARTRDHDQVDIAFPHPGTPPRAGEEVVLRFRVDDRATRQPRGGLQDLQVQSLRAPGTDAAWHPAAARPDGEYEVRFHPRKAGVYFLFFRCPSIGLDVDEAQRLVLEVVADRGG